MDFSGYSSCGGFDDGQGVKSRFFLRIANAMHESLLSGWTKSNRVGDENTQLDCKGYMSVCWFASERKEG